MDKFEELRVKGTRGAKQGLSTESIIARLREWDYKYGLTLAGVAHDRVLTHLALLPDDMDAFASEVYVFCPETIDQNFGRYLDWAESVAETGEELPDGVRALAEGVDLSDDNFGLELLKRSLLRDRIVCLWWD